MARNFIGDVDRVHYTNTTGATIASGAPVFTNSGVGVALVNIGAGAAGPVQTRGTVRWPKQPGLAIAQLAEVYWDAVNSRITTSSGAFVGRAAVAAGASEADVVVALSGNIPASSMTASQVSQAQAMVSGAWNQSIASLGVAFRAAVGSNPRTKAKLSTSVVAFGGTPTAGTLGYANSSIVTTNHTTYDLRLGAGSAAPMRAEGAGLYYPGTPVQSVAYYSSGGTRRSGTWRLRIMTNAPEPIFTVIGSSQVYAFSVDGQRADANLAAPSGGGYQDVSINLRGLGAGWHEIELLLQQNDTIAQIKIPQTSLLMTPPARPCIALFTDSLGNTAPDVTAVDCLGQVIADYMGADVRLMAAGSSGYAVAGSSEDFVSRVPLAATQLAASGVSPAAVVFAGGINDTAGATLQQKAQEAFEAAEAAWPLAKVVALGSWAQNNSTNQTQAVTKEGQIKAAAAAAGVLFVPVMTDTAGAWITGSGNTSSPTGTGTSDVLFASSDSTHWAGAGHLAIGRKAALGIASALAL